MSSWRCPVCESVKKPARNDELPVRGLNQSLNDTSMSVDDYGLEERSIIGETQNLVSISSKRSPSPYRSTEGITLDNFRQLLDAKLEEKLENHKFSIIEEIRSAFKSEINKAVQNLKQEIAQNTDTLRSEQVSIKEDISYLDEKVEKLEMEKNKLQLEIQNLHKNADRLLRTEDDNSKKLVIYGLDEYNSENETELEKRIIYMFRDVMCTDLTGYIEEIKRLGKYGRRRPILLELLSKRMTKYILSNVKQFRSTGVYVTEFLNGKGLQDKRQAQEKVYSTGKSGHANTSIQTPTIKPAARAQSSTHQYNPLNEKLMKISGTFRV